METIHQLAGHPPRRRGPGRTAQKDGAAAAAAAPPPPARHPGENAAFAKSETEVNRDALEMLAAWRAVDVPEDFAVPCADAPTARAYANLFADMIVTKSWPDVVSIYLSESEQQGGPLRAQAPNTLEAYLNAAGADRGHVQRIPDLWRDVGRDTAAAANLLTGPQRCGRLFAALGHVRIAARPANRLQSAFTGRAAPVVVRVRMQRADDTPSDVVRRRFMLPMQRHDGDDGSSAEEPQQLECL